MGEIIKISNVTQALEFISQPKPKHPLVAIYRHEEGTCFNFGDVKIAANLYSISFKDGIEGQIGYGRNSYDFREGTLVFFGPNQVVSPGEVKVTNDSQGWNLLFHPELIRGESLGDNIDNYTFFEYGLSEALHTSNDEKEILIEIIGKIEKEINNNLDRHSHKLIVTNLELLLDYCFRFYGRQFYTRTRKNKDLITIFERSLRDYFKHNKQHEFGLPTVKYFGELLNVSPNYLSDMLKKETDRSAIDHIQSFIINKAKTLLKNSSTSVSEIAFDLGYEYSQHFSKVFKKRTGMSPIQYRVAN